MRGGPFVLEALHAGLRARGQRLERDAIRVGTVRWRSGTGPAPDAGREVHAGTVAAALEARGWGRAIAREYASGTLPREGVNFRIQLASPTAWALAEICDRYPIAPKGRIPGAHYDPNGIREVRALWAPAALADALHEAGPALRDAHRHHAALVERTRRELVLIELEPRAHVPQAPDALMVFDVHWYLHDEGDEDLARHPHPATEAGEGALGVWYAPKRRVFELTYAMDAGTAHPGIAHDRPEVLRLPVKRGGYSAPADGTRTGRERVAWLRDALKGGLVDGACRWHERESERPRGEAPASTRSDGTRRRTARGATPPAPPPLFQLWHLPAPRRPDEGTHRDTHTHAGREGTNAVQAAAHTVRGHWRWQACGPARRERTLTWVRAHWRNRGRGLLGEILTPTA